jgi:L-alanine-DL-glutamate epimerase-like enolase superfamily enzyme
MGSLGFAPDLLARFVDSQFADLLVGRNPFATESIAADLRRRTIYYGELGMSAWPRSAVDVALWDLKAQAAGQPLYRLLGGDDPRIRAYASSMDARHDREELADLHGGYADEGFTAFKTKVGNRPPAVEAERVGEVREAVGENADLFIDANQAWTVTETLDVAKAVSPHNVGWIEEPISEFNEAAYGRLAGWLDTQLATGEMFYRPERFRRFLEVGGADIVQPDLIRAGGVSGQFEVAKLAHRYGVPMASHFYYAVSAHVVAAAPNGRIVEYIPEYDIAPVLETPPEVRDGHVILPDRPGHGYRIDPDARTEYEVSFD